MSASATIGCIGKLPLFGDFVRLNGEASPCLSALDRWLQQGIENGYMQEGRPFEARLRSFQPTRIVCWSAADSGWSGLLMPSADQVGRVYPILTGWQHTNPVTPDVMPLVGREEAEGLQAFVEKAQVERPSLEAFLQDLNATTLSPGAPGACAKLEEFLRESSLESLCRGWVDGGIPQRRARALRSGSTPPAAGAAALPDGHPLLRPLRGGRILVAVDRREHAYAIDAFAGRVACWQGGFRLDSDPVRSTRGALHGPGPLAARLREEHAGPPRVVAGPPRARRLRAVRRSRRERGHAPSIT